MERVMSYEDSVAPRVVEIDFQECPRLPSFAPAFAVPSLHSPHASCFAVRCSGPASRPVLVVRCTWRR